jgi:probable rRNA maturation factor
MTKRSLYIKFSATDRFDDVNYNLKSIVREAIMRTLDYEDFIYDAEVSVTFCDNAYIKRLNKKYRNKDKATDVLSFPMYDQGELPSGTDADGATVVLGDIVVSVERAAAQAVELGHSTDREIAFLCIHSTLHLLGYDHELGKDEEEDMCRRQRDIIAKLSF